MALNASKDLQGTNTLAYLFKSVSDEVKKLYSVVTCPRRTFEAGMVKT